MDRWQWARRADRMAGERPRVRISVVPLVVFALLLTAGCAEVTAPGIPVVLLVGGTSGEPRPQLTPAVRVLLAEAAGAQVSSAEAVSTATVTSVDGTTHTTLPLTPQRADGSIEHGLQRDTLIKRNLAAVTDAVADTTTATSGVDLLDGIAIAVRGRAGGVLVVVSNGLSTTGGLDLRALGWNAEPTDVAHQLSKHGLLQSLIGFRVIFTGLGTTAGEQPALPKPCRDRLIAYWQAICAESGAISCVIDEAAAERQSPVGRVPQPIVEVPGVRSVTGPAGETTTSFSNDVLGFAGDRWELSADGIDLVRAVAARIRARSTQEPNRLVTVTGHTADPEEYSDQQLIRLAQARADTVAAVLRQSGILQIRSHGAGPAPGMTARMNGSFNETLGAQMRRVEITS